MDFSLILATMNRAEILQHCLESIKKQENDSYELIIIDQSSNNQTEELVLKEKTQNIIYKHVLYRGLSKARNEAIKLSQGKYIVLMDDDAYYNSNYLDNAKMHLKTMDSHSILSGYLWDTERECMFVDYNQLKEGVKLSHRQITRYCPSPAIIFPHKMINDVGFFDENFGVGAKYGAAEETDLLLRAKKKGYNVYYYKDMQADHPHKYTPPTENEIEKISKYSYGIGAMYCKQFQSGNKAQLFFPFTERIIKDMIHAIKDKKRVTLLIELIHGYNNYKKNETKVHSTEALSGNEEQNA